MTNLKNQTSSKNQTPNGNKYDLEERSLIFAKDVRLFVPRLPRTIANAEDTKQLVRSSGSVGANYLNESRELMLILTAIINKAL
ncbi:hypothetical protein HYT04_02220 [Candidatus Kaiserbacteria bacterium]|nr:hypothetical protein [Candidatus Kaiserbacteria bacterium]